MFRLALLSMEAASRRAHVQSAAQCARCWCKFVHSCAQQPAVGRQAGAQTDAGQWARQNDARTDRQTGRSQDAHDRMVLAGSAHRARWHQWRRRRVTLLGSQLTVVVVVSSCSNRSGSLLSESSLAALLLFPWRARLHGQQPRQALTAF